MVVSEDVDLVGKYGYSGTIHQTLYPAGEARETAMEKLLSVDQVAGVLEAEPCQSENDGAAANS